MDTPRYLTALREHGAALVDAADGRLDTRVPSCPGWTMADLLWHVGEVHHFWRAIASGAVKDPERDHTEPVRPTDADLSAWYRDGLARTLAELTALDPTAPRWTWAPRKDGSFIQRRMAQETMVHAWDGLNAIGRSEPLPAEMAADGVDEFLTYFLGLREILGPPVEPVGPVGTVLLTATDTGHVWTVDHTGEHWRMRREEHRASCAVTGNASDLLLALWRRAGTDTLKVEGDAEALPLLIRAAETE